MSADDERPPGEASPPERRPADGDGAALPTARVSRRREWLPSLIWLIPIVAALVGVALVARILRDRGPEIEISFLSAEGLEAGKTAVKYKDVQIGVVQAVRLARDREHVSVRVQLQKDAEGFTAADTRFWVVRPRLDTSGISGLTTLLSGAYIGADAGESSDTTSEFKGLEQPPIITRGAQGRSFLLHAKDVGSLDIGAPLYFRRIKVGQVVSYQLDEDGRGVTLRVFINAPYDKYVGVNTRFWHASGVDLQFNASGFKLQTQSLASIALGGIAFQAPDDQLGSVASENTEFALAEDQVSAMSEPDGESRSVLMYFNQSLRGLSPGAPVDFRGIVIGEVKSIGVEFDREQREFRMPVYIEIYPERLRRHARERELPNRWTSDQRLRFLVERGLRAQLRTGNLLTGQLYVALDFFPKSPRVTVNVDEPLLELPTIPNSLDDLQAQVQELAIKLNRVPYEEIGQDLRKTLAQLQKTLGSIEGTSRQVQQDLTPEMVAAMKDVRSTLAKAERNLADNDAPVQQELRATLRELGRAASSLRILADYLERHPESLVRGKPKDKE